MKKLLKHKYWYYEEMSDSIFIDFFDANFGHYQDFITRLGRARTEEVEELVSHIRTKKYSRKQLLSLIHN